jgi:hypothetical protein
LKFIKILAIFLLEAIAQESTFGCRIRNGMQMQACCVQLSASMIIKITTQILFLARFFLVERSQQKEKLINFLKELEPREIRQTS